MSDAEYLASFRQLAQMPTDGARGMPTDPGIDLIEHEQRAIAVTADGARQRRAPFVATPPCAALNIASITRDSSPPDATSRNGPNGKPGFGAIRNSTLSRPRPRTRHRVA